MTVRGFGKIGKEWYCRRTADPEDCCRGCAFQNFVNDPLTGGVMEECQKPFIADEFGECLITFESDNGMPEILEDVIYVKLGVRRGDEEQSMSEVQGRGERQDGRSPVSDGRRNNVGLF